MEPPYSLDALSMASESLYDELDSDVKDSKVYPTGKRPNRIVSLGSKSTSLKGMVILMFCNPNDVAGVEKRVIWTHKFTGPTSCVIELCLHNWDWGKENQVTQVEIYSWLYN